ncbi:MAG TPA: hypothetical protein PK970_03140 [Hyphomicrobiaceae bacterium]|nr:hypothetical protein [Hyphomicrobiaceae bacterium]
MSIRVLLAAFAVAVFGLSPAVAQRGGGSNWELLGETNVGYGADRDVISVGRPEDHFRSRSYDRLRIVADRGEFNMRSVQLRYINGFEEEVAINRNLTAGQEVVVDLPATRSFLSQIELRYAARPGFSFDGRGVTWNRPRVKVFASNRGFGLPSPDRPRDPPGAGWDEIGRTQFSAGDDEVTVRVGRREGRFSAIRVRSEGRPVVLRNMVVRFGNGESQIVRLNERMEPGELTRPIDVDGNARFIERITFRTEPRRGGGRTDLIVYGLDRPGGPGAGRPTDDRRRNWTLLGQQKVNFQTERDVIRVGQSEDWHRARSFDKLHFVSVEGDIQMDEIRIVYINGYAEAIRVGREIREGQDIVVDLPGRRSFISQIEMQYKSRLRIGGRGMVQVYGEGMPGR